MDSKLFGIACLVIGLIIIVPFLFLFSANVIVVLNLATVESIIGMIVGLVILVLGIIIVSRK